MKFTMAVEKHQAASAGRAEGHNTRLHATASQLPKEAWITPKGRYQVKAWDADKLRQARSLAKRKDAVLAIELVLQVGNQTDWREPPTTKHPHGKPKPVDLDVLKALSESARAAAEQEFGAENIVGIDLHTDESTPHVHVVVVPIHQGKLQAKHWLDGPRMVAALRKRIHQAISARIPCEYTPGAPGGAPHDPGKAAGQPGGQKPAPGLLDRLAGALDKQDELEAARKKIDQLQKQVQSLFSKLKRAEQTAADRLEAMQSARRKEDEMREDLQLAQVQIRELETRVAELTPAPSDPEGDASRPRPRPGTSRKPALDLG